MDDTPDWLPPLILFTDYRGQWNDYIDAVYDAYCKDFMRCRPQFRGETVHSRYHPAHGNKGATFWHLVSEGKVEEERIPDLRRCERIRWPRPIIENSELTDVKVWEGYRPWRGQLQTRVNFSLFNFSYLVVIAKNSRGYDLLTAYWIEQEHRRRKLKREYEDFWRQKKEGSAS
ncbi:MAG: hypothetical protein CMO81_00165 [Waddliaceae bacterium]|nr:hypothetical protein [Waddliaceae bacterium]|tara:strand:+ start:673 stop:1191 length:519 start_codon:yes stop_codon:yes gene_type:complete